MIESFASNNKLGATSGLVLTVLTLVACSPAPQGPLFPLPVLELAGAGSAPSIPTERAEPVLARARAYETSTGDLSAVVAVTVRDIAHNQNFSSRGAIAVHRPNAMRMQMSGPGGITAVDLLARDGHYWSRIAGREWVTGNLADPPANGFPAATIARAFLGFDWDHAILVSDDVISLARVPSPDGYALVAFDRRDGATREVRWFVGGVEHSRVRFAELQNEANGARFPQVVLFWQSQPDVTSTITVEHRSVAPTLPAQTFTPPTIAPAS